MKFLMRLLTLDIVNQRLLRIFFHIYTNSLSLRIKNQVWSFLIKELLRQKKVQFQFKTIKIEMIFLLTFVNIVKGYMILRVNWFINKFKGRSELRVFWSASQPFLFNLIKILKFQIWSFIINKDRFNIKKCKGLFLEQIKDWWLLWNIK